MSSVSETKAEELNINTGIERNDREALAHHLSKALADTYMLSVKTQSFHWNVAGPLFYSLHKMTEDQYEDLFQAADEIAERIRAVGFPAPGSFGQFMDLSSLKEEQGVPGAEDMIRQLAEDNEKVARVMRLAVDEAEKVDDVKTADMLTERLGQHEENVWMLRALLA